MNTRAKVFSIGTGLIASAAYLTGFVFCIGGSACDTFFPLLKFPFLLLMPLTGSRVFGFDAVNVLTLLNAAFWFFAVSGITSYVLKRGQ
jgi:hypothetical protein